MEFVHTGPKTPAVRDVAMVLRYDADAHKAIICAPWGQVLSGRGQAGTAAAVKWRCPLT